MDDTTVVIDASALVVTLKRLQNELSTHFDKLTEKGADGNKIAFAKSQLMNACMVALDAIKQGRQDAAQRAKGELL
jgi:hypothetical protein